MQHSAKAPSAPYPKIPLHFRPLLATAELDDLFVFTSERGAPFTTAGFARMVERAGSEAKLGFKTHPHMLRHACGYALANKGHDTRALQAYLGHRNIQHTATCILEKRKPVTDQDDRNINVIGTSTRYRLQINYR
jgi:integrase